MMEWDAETQTMRMKEEEKVCLTGSELQAIVRGGYKVGFGVCLILALVGTLIYMAVRKK